MPDKNNKTVILSLHYYVPQGVTIPDEFSKYEGDELISKGIEWFEKTYEDFSLCDFDGEYFSYTFDCPAEVPSRLATDFLSGNSDAVKKICKLAEQQNGEKEGFYNYTDYDNLNIYCDKENNFDKKKPYIEER